MIYKTSQHSDKGNELTIESFYFNISIVENKADYVVINNDNNNFTHVRKSVIESITDKSIIKLIVLSYGFINAGTPKPNPKARAFYGAMKELARVAGIHNSAYDSLIREAVGPEYITA